MADGGRDLRGVTRVRRGVAACGFALSVLAGCGGAGKPPQSSARTGGSPAQPGVQTSSSSSGGSNAQWLVDVQKRVKAGEYAIRPRNAAFQASNRAQGLMGSWESGGLSISLREETDSKAVRPTTLRTLGVQRPGSPIRASARAGGTYALGACRSDKMLDERGDCLKRLELRLSPGVVEWWENKPNGIEQGFTLTERPAGSSRRPVEIDIAVSGARVRVDESQSSARLVRSDGAHFGYTGLVAWDSTGARIPARLSSTPGGLRILIDDREAKYPVVVDPVIVNPSNSWAIGSGQAGAGVTSGTVMTVAAAGDVNGDGRGDVAVSFPRFDGPNGTDAGLVLVFHGEAGGLPTSANKTLNGLQQGELFGRSVAAGDVNGDGFGDLIVGASSWDADVGTNATTNEGRAYLFHGSGSGLSSSPNWTGTGMTASNFGQAVGATDVNNDGASDIIVGARGGTSGATTRAGAVFVYFGDTTAASPTGVRADAPWTVSASANGTFFGGAVAGGDINGDGRGDVIVGESDLANGNTLEGKVQVFIARDPSGALNTALPTTADWFREGGEDNAKLGRAVAFLGDVNGDGMGDLAVGSEANRAYIYYGQNAASGSGVLIDATVSATAPTNALKDPQNLSANTFGFSVGRAGDVNGDGYADLIVGAYFDGPGRVYLFLGSNAGLITPHTWTQDGPAMTSWFGHTVAGAGDVNGDGFGDLVVAAPEEDTGGTNAGRAFLYLGSSETSGLAASGAAWSVESDRASAMLGWAVASAGDVNGDGYADIALAAPDFFGPTAGNVLVYHGAAGGPDTTADWSLSASSGLARFGRSVAGAGDINADGYGDLVIGAQDFTNDATNTPGEGCIVVIYGSASGLIAGAPTCTFESNANMAALGTSVAGAGDVNGDGYADVIAGAPNLNGNAGRIYVLLGGAGGLQTTGTGVWTRDGPAGSLFGNSVGGPGDVDGDGYGDVVVGAPFFSSEKGRISVYFGGATDFKATPQDIDGETTGERFGQAVAGAGDVNGDGLADVIAGAPLYTNGEMNEGRASVFRGSATGLVSPPWTAQADNVGARLGSSVASAGDVNGDGLGDVIVGAPLFTVGQSGEGRAIVYLSPGMGGQTTAAPSWWYESDAVNANAGQSVAGVGDVNGDGFSDVIVGAPGFTGMSPSDQTGEGRGLVFFGNTKGRALSLRAQRPTAANLVQPGGLIPGGIDSFRVLLSRVTPAGRTRVRAELEVKPRGSAFDGSNPILSGWIDSATASDEILNVTGLTKSTGYHFRVRLHYDAARTPAWLHTRWFYGGLLGQSHGIHVRTDAGAAVGTACTADGQCGSGFCVDGYCCNMACGGNNTTDCVACSEAAKGRTGAGNGICEARAMGASCNDANMCTANETCDAAGACQGGTQVVCMPPNPCQEAATCNPASGCVYQVKANGTACDDGNKCTTGDACQAGSCAGSAVVCMAPDTCHDAGTCDPATGMCSNAPTKSDGTACSDNNMCTRTDTCVAGVCTGANPVPCMASDQCHDTGMCDPATGMCSNPSKADGTACDDGNMCTVMDVCMAGACSAGQARSCDDNNMCTTDTCAPAQGCMNTQVPNCSTPGGDAGADAAVDAAPADASVPTPADARTDGPPATVDAAADRPPADAPAAMDVPRDTPPTGTVDMQAPGTDTGTITPPADGGPARDGGLAPDARDAGGDRPKTSSGSSGCSCDVGRRDTGGVVFVFIGIAGAMILARTRRKRSR